MCVDASEENHQLNRRRRAEIKTFFHNYRDMTFNQTLHHNVNIDSQFKLKKPERSLPHDFAQQSFFSHFTPYPDEINHNIFFFNLLNRITNSLSLAHVPRLCTAFDVRHQHPTGSRERVKMQKLFIQALIDM